MAILSVRLAVSAVIIIVVLLLKSIDIPATRWAVDRVREAITYDFSINETLGKLKFVSKYILQAVLDRIWNPAFLVEQEDIQQSTLLPGRSGRAV